MLLSSVVAVLVGYFIGSIPAAYVFVKYATRRDIRHEGSGNVGALNSYEVTRKKWIGIAVLLFDICKGSGAVLIASQFVPTDYTVQALAGLSAVLGHNFNVWLGFHGGRGLATALGVMLLLGWIFALVWCLVWGIAYSIRQDIHGGNVTAILLAPVTLIVLPHSWIEMSSRTVVTAAEVVVVCGVMSVLLLIRHAGYIRGLFGTDHQKFSSEH